MACTGRLEEAQSIGDGPSAAVEVLYAGRGSERPIRTGGEPVAGRREFPKAILKAWAKFRAEFGGRFGGSFGGDSAGMEQEVGGKQFVASRLWEPFGRDGRLVRIGQTIPKKSLRALARGEIVGIFMTELSRKTRSQNCPFPSLRPRLRSGVFSFLSARDSLRFRSLWRGWRVTVFPGAERNAVRARQSRSAHFPRA